MLHILLTILGIIARGIGILLLILLILLLVLLFVPFRYRAGVKKEEGEKLTDARGSFGVSWLLRLLDISGRYADGALDVEVRVGPVNLRRLSKHIEILKKKEPDGDSSDGAGADDAFGRSEEAERETLDALLEEDRQLQPPPKPGLPERLRSLGHRHRRPRRESTDGSGQEEMSGSFGEDAQIGPENRQTRQERRQKLYDAAVLLISSLPERLSSLIVAFFDVITVSFGGSGGLGEKIDSVKKKYRKLDTENNRQALCLILRVLMRMLRHFRIRRIRGYLHFGTGAPDLTGYAVGLLDSLLPASADRFELQPDFLEACFDTEMDLKGHVRLHHVTAAVLRLAVSPKIWKLVRSLLRLRSKKK